jgi:hypothetical protein
VYPLQPTDVLYGFASVNADGLIADRAVTDTLGWHAGDRLTLTAKGGIVAVRRDRHARSSDHAIKQGLRPPDLTATHTVRQHLVTAVLTATRR